MSKHCPLWPRPRCRTAVACVCQGRPVCCRWEFDALPGRVSLKTCCCHERCNCSVLGFFTLANTCSLPSSDASGDDKVYARRATGRAGTFSERLGVVVHPEILMGALGSTAPCTRACLQDGRSLASSFALGVCVATPDGGASGCGDLGRRSVVGAAPVPARSKRSGHGGVRGFQSSLNRTCKKMLRGRTLDSDHFLRHTFWIRKSNMEPRRSAGSSMLDIARCGTCWRTQNA